MSNKHMDTKTMESMIKSCNNENELRELLDSKPIYKIGYYLDDILRKKNLTKADLFKKANIEESYGYQLLRGVRKFPRDRVIQLGIAMGLTLDETNDFLKQTEHQPLYQKARNNRDAVIMFCIQKKLDLIDTELVLEKFNEKSIQNFKEYSD